MMKRPVGIDLFAGAGGMSLGFEQAGFDIAVAVEYDPVHAATHLFNFPQTVVVPRPIEDLSGEVIREAAGLGSKTVDVVFGGAPCQGFSLIGQRLFDDPRNGLVKEFLRLVTELDAKYFVFENVKGLTVGKHRNFLHALVNEFTDSGYVVRMPWKVLNSSHYGVPQNRERLFLLGVRKGGKLPDYPEPTTGDADVLFDGVGRTPTCVDAIGDLPDAEKFDELIASDSVKVSRWGAASEYASKLRCENGEDWYFGYRREWDPTLLTSSMRTDHTEISRRRFSTVKAGQTEPISRFFKLPSNGVCNTLRAGTDSARGAFTSPRPIHYRSPRCITVREMARLHGYPDWFRFHATKWHGARQVGNSVPPPLARAVATSVIKSIGTKPSPPLNLIRLGDPSLLAMDMTQAAAYFGIEAPIGRRDCKSGAKKRKQMEIEASGQNANGAM